MEIKTVDKPQMRVIGLPHQGAYSKIGETFGELHKFESQIGNAGKGLVAIYFDDPHKVPEENLRSLAGVIVSDDVDLDVPDLEVATIPAGRYAMTEIDGDYSKLPAAWEGFYGKIFADGLKTKADLCYEKYLNTPMDVSPDKLETELYAPLA
jgi:AraC family transcriptional regulator